MLLSGCGQSILDDQLCLWLWSGRSDYVWLCWRRGKDDESVSDLMMSSQTKGNWVSDVKLRTRRSVFSHVFLSALSSRLPILNIYWGFSQLYQQTSALLHITPHEAKLHVLQTSRYFIHVLGFVHLGSVSVIDIWECVKDVCPDCLKSIWPFVM